MQENILNYEFDVYEQECYDDFTDEEKKYFHSLPEKKQERYIIVATNYYLYKEIAYSVRNNFLTEEEKKSLTMPSQYSPEWIKFINSGGNSKLTLPQIKKIRKKYFGFLFDEAEFDEQAEMIKKIREFYKNSHSSKDEELDRAVELFFPYELLMRDLPL